ncbi:MAG: MiaB/RimO family radical SAM methylthiotransferase [Thermoguttaceae bacterium]
MRSLSDHGIEFTIISLGCPKNLVDSENMVGRLQTAGFRFVPRAESSDFVLLNTCGFLESAREEAREQIEDLTDLKSQGFFRRIFVTGCMVNFEGEDLAFEFPEVDAWIGVADEQQIVPIIQSFFPEQPIVATTLISTVSTDPVGPAHLVTLGEREDHRQSCLAKKHPRFYFEAQNPLPIDDSGRSLLTPKHLAYLKIAEGCSRGCSYCAIPQIRGRYISKPKEAVLKEAEQLVNRGVRELVLIAQETTFWGIDLYGKPQLASLLDSLRKIKGLEYIRLMYTYPMFFEDDLIALFSEEASRFEARMKQIGRGGGNPNVTDRAIGDFTNTEGGGILLPYIDIPLQHANDVILKRMNRQVSKQQMEELLGRLRDRIPNLVLRTSFIVGFPGESDSMFEELLQFAQVWKFERGGVFRFSAEPGTGAEKLDGQIPLDLIEERAVVLEDIMEQNQSNWDQSRAGKPIEVMIDVPYSTPDGDRVKDVYLGRSYAESPDVDPLVIVNGKKLKPGHFYRCEIVQVDGSNLIAATY